jgi:O-antigen/teichoic acid export membrane protein
MLNLTGQLATLMVGFVPSVLVARWLGPSDRGLLAIVSTAGFVAFVVVSVGLPAAVLYFGSKKDPPTGALLANSVLYAAVITVGCVVPVWLLRHQIADLLSHGRGETAWVVAAFVIPATFLDWTTHNQLLGKLRFGLYNALIVSSKVAYLVLVVVLLRVVSLGVSGVLVATIASSLVVVAGSLGSIVPGAALRINRDLFRRMLEYGRKAQIGAIFQFMNARFDVLILQFFVPLASVGYYVVAQFLAELVMLLTRSFQSSVTSLVARDAHDVERQSATTAMSLRHHGLLSAGGIAVNVVVAPLLVVFGYGHAYEKAIIPFFIILPGIWFLGAGLLIGNDLSGRNRPGLASSLSGAAVAVTIVLDLALIPFFGVIGAAVASLVAYVVFGVASLAAESRVAGLHWRSLMPTLADAAAYPLAARRLLFGR